MQAKIKASSKKIRNYITITALSIVAFIQLYPFIWLIFLSFKSDAEIFGENVMGFPQKLLFENYSSAIFTGHVLTFFINSVIVTLATIAATTILSSMASYALVRMKWKLARVTLIMFLLGLMIPLHAVLFPLMLVLKNLNLLGSYWSLIIPYTAFSMSMAIFVITGFLKGIPYEMEESACIDGAGIFTTFFTIIMPLVRPAIATSIVFTYLTSWNELMFAVTYISSDKYKTLTVGMNNMMGQYSTHWGPLGAGLVIATIPTIIIYILLSKQVQESLTAGAVKG